MKDKYTEKELGKAYWIGILVGFIMCLGMFGVAILTRLPELLMVVCPK